VGYQQFFDFLPGALSGLGIQANYTYVDSKTTSSIVGPTTPLQGLSKHTYNLVGMYENTASRARRLQLAQHLFRQHLSVQRGGAAQLPPGLWLAGRLAQL
jgi:outer membrane receptor protein involved in Fe transport